MSHDEVVTLLSEDPTGPLPPAARAHAEACAECGALLSALDAIAQGASDDEASPPAGYWDDFDARLSRRLGEAAPSRSPARTRAWLAAAAATLVVAAAFALMREHTTAPAEGAAASPGLIALVTREDPDAVLDAARSITGWDPAGYSQSMEAQPMEALADSDPALENSPAEDLGWSADPLSDPLARLEDDLSSLDSEQARALAARLEEELKS